MSTFHTRINQIQGNAVFGDNTVNNNIIGAPAHSTADLQRQIEELQRLLDAAPAIPEETRAATAEALREAKETPPGDAKAKSTIVEKLTGARKLLEATTGVTKEIKPLIEAVGKVIGVAAGIVT